MKLDTRRRIRGWLLEMPDATLLWTAVAGIGLMVLGIITETSAVFGVGFAVALAAIYVNGIASSDACPNCRSDVNATADRYCVTCGARLDDLEAAPPIDERVDERNRPVGIRALEQRAWAERSPYPDVDDDNIGEYHELRGRYFEERLKDAPLFDELPDSEGLVEQLEEIERSPDIGAVADGGEFNEHDESEVAS